MNLKRAAGRQPVLRTALGRSLLLRIGLGLVALGAFAASLLAAIGYGMYLHEVKVADSLASFVENTLETRLAVFPNFVRGRLASPERITIDVKHKDFLRLAFKREQALDRGLLLTSSDDFVPGKIRYGDRTLKVKLRLKGDWVDHLVGEKWSFRVKVRGDETLFGMKVFSLHHPRTRSWVNEWLYHAALQREGVLGLRYRFVDVIVNGKDLGIYALEEHFDKRLIEHQAQREGPILKFSEDTHWADLAAHGRKGEQSPTGLQAERASHPDGFRRSATLGDPALYRRFQAALELLEAFRARELATSQVFDVEKLAAYFAITDLMGADHGANWINLRFYFNPITARLEPVGFDGNAGKPIQQVLGFQRDSLPGVNKFKDVAFSDPVFFRAYVQALERVSQKSYLDRLLDEVDPELQRNLAILHQEFPWLHFSTRVFYENQRIIAATLKPVLGLHAYYAGSEGDTLYLELGNAQGMPLEVLGVSQSGGTALEPAARVILAPSAHADRIEYERVSFTLPAAPREKPPLERDLRVHYRLLGLDDERTEAVLPWLRRAPELWREDPTQQHPNAREFEFVDVDTHARRIRIRAGSWTLERDLILPPGYRVVAGPGVKLDLRNGANVISYSPVELLGSAEAPVVIHSSDGSGQGFSVIAAEQRSELQHVRFRNLANPAKGGWELTGAVTFYESPVRIAHCEFAENRSEDGLNLVRSAFEIDTTLFRATHSDAFDADFADGRITRSAFELTGNDAIDVSGSRVTVSQVRVKRAGDKALSAGENARLFAEDVHIDGAQIGMASKDLSHLEAHDISVRGAAVGLAVFRKKSEFGPARLEVSRLRLEDVPTAYLVETGSTLQVDGRTIESNGDRLRDTLYSAKGVEDVEPGS